MVSTPPKINTPNDSNDKVNIMSPYQDFSQYIDSSSPQVKPGDYEDYFYDIDILTGNDIFHAEPQSYEISPELASSMTTPSLILDGISPHDSPLYNLVASPSLDPALGFFPDLTDPTVVAAARRSLMQQIPIPPSLTIPVDDTSTLTTLQDSSTVSPTLSPALNIPWNPETAGPSSTDDLLQNTSSLSPLSPHTSTFSDNTANNSPKSSTTAISSTSNISPTINKLNTRSRKRSNEEIDKDPQIVADELALKRAKNTDAARRSRLRRVMKMEALEKQVANLKNENNDLQTRIAVLESEKKGLEDKYAEKDARVNMLEQQLSEAHERLVKRSRE